uniref:G-protein alpha subunit n=1 Tax=Caenorhabditis tropicalis TaxID=1561998 RepID=A0A1I7V1P1_9PELO
MTTPTATSDSFFSVSIPSSSSTNPSIQDRRKAEKQQYSSKFVCSTNNISRNPNIFIEELSSIIIFLNVFKRYARAQSIIADEENHYGLFSKELAEKIKCIWNDKSMQKLYALRSQFNLNDSASYFLNNIDKINTVDYKPSDKDLIMAYVPTCGVQNVVFTAANQSFQLFDIGGQKIDRRKWATQYEGIDAIFFCIAISEYDQVMSEDQVTNRLDDALALLQQISEEPMFATTPIYLFLNEIDVFCEKLHLIPLSKYKPDFKGGDTDDALDFMESLACGALGKRDRSLYRVYRTVAIDTQMMAELLATVFKDIMKRKK